MTELELENEPQVFDDSNLNLTVEKLTKSDGQLYKLILRSDKYAYDTSFMNALRRVAMNNSYCYALSPTIIDTINDESKFKTHNMETQKLIAKKLFDSGKNGVFSRAPIVPSVLQSTCGNTQLLSHRLSRIPVKANSSLLDESIIYFIVIGNLTDDLTLTSYVNNTNKLVTIYSDLKEKYIHLLMYHNDKISKCDNVELIAQLFPVRIPIACLKKNQSLLAISFINRNYEKMDARFIPCNTRYRYIPKLADEPHILLTDDKLLELFSYDNQKQRLDNGLGDLEFDYQLNELYQQPKGIELTIEYNYKMAPDTCLINGINYLIQQLNTFKTEYLNSTSEIITKKLRTPYLQIITVKNGKSEFDFNLADHTLGNLISSHLVYNVFDFIMKDGNFEPDEISQLAANIQIAYMKGHHLIDEIEIQYQLPFNLQNENLALYQKYFGNKDTTTQFMDEYRNELMVEVIDNLISRLEQVRAQINK